MAGHSCVGSIGEVFRSEPSARVRYPAATGYDAAETAGPCAAAPEKSVSVFGDKRGDPVDSNVDITGVDVKMSAETSNILAESVREYLCLLAFVGESLGGDSRLMRVDHHEVRVRFGGRQPRNGIKPGSQ
ncbi:MAG: hypothetical protein J07HR59_00968, partial [Halorubrum sp. J07HR59]